MKKGRSSIRKSVSESVLNEYRHLCAICGSPRPQLHHINTNPSDNDYFNLIPLCPNCHLTDQHDPHDPTKPIDPEILALFRRYKDPTILTPQFVPIFQRSRFLFSCIPTTWAEYYATYQTFLRLIGALYVGDFYATEMSRILCSVSVEPIVGENEEEKRAIL